MLSELLGYASIFAWLFAQFPQVLENIRRQSCDGLALTFLLNWLAGDASNLLGCLLTSQLPFQTWLAVYFVTVDLTLCVQYFYYSSDAPVHPTSHSRRFSVDHPSTPRYRTLSAVAANVASAAALAAQQDEYTERHSRSRRARTGTEHSILDREDPDEEDSALAALTASFISEDGGRSSRGRISWSKERYARRGVSSQRPSGLPALSLGLPPLQTATASMESPSIMHDPARGRSTQRPETGENEDSAAELDADTHRRSSRASRRGAGMVFLGMWALFGVGTFAGRKRAGVGRVITGEGLSTPVFPVAVAAAVYGDVNTDPMSTNVVFDVHPDDEEPMFNQRMVGRMFAWLCTTLYLTSRLPQIWKNYERKSVEGLSMALFVFAFLGNVFYVASILSSPQASSPDATEYIQESIPFLLGSAGTLCFDITIVGQSFIYRSSKAAHPLRVGSSRGRIIEEEEGLLHEEPLERSKSRSSVR